MRMWMVDPEILCKNHLLGEHCECHMFLGTLQKKKSVSGYIEKNLFQPLQLKERHDKLKAEMARRGMNHKSDLNVCDELDYLPESYLNYKVDAMSSHNDLMDRCPRCRERFNKKIFGKKEEKVYGK